jgi:hypothetical protein
MTPRPLRARTHSLCGTSRRLEAEGQSSAQAARIRCRPPAIWECQKSETCSRRMAMVPGRGLLARPHVAES